MTRTSVRDAVTDAVSRVNPEGEGGAGSPLPAPSPRAAAIKAGMDRRRAAGKPIGRPRKSAAAAAEPEPAPVPEPVTEAEIQGYAAVGKTLWSLAGPMLHLRNLNESEGCMLGEALAPVCKKWIPFMDRWAEETNLAMCLLILYQSTREPKQEGVEDATLSSDSPAPEGAADGNGGDRIGGA